MKLFLKGLLALVVLAIVGVVIALLPAHLQIRQINPPLPGEAELRALLTAEKSPTRVSYLATSSQVSTAGMLGHTSVLIEWADGRLMMIDAGMDVAAATSFGELMTSMMGAGQVHIEGTISDLLGDAIERVQAVGFTHLHIDHSQGLVNFCAARGEGALAIQTTYQAQEHNYNTTEGADIVATSCLQAGALEGDDLIPLPGFPGVAIYPLGGHTPGSTLFAVADGERLLLFSSE